MRTLLSLFVMVALGLPAFAGPNFDMTIAPKYQDNLEAFMTLHKQLTVQERSVAASLGVGMLEMDSVRKIGSYYSSHEQLLEKRLNDPLHYVQLGLQLGNIIAQVLTCANEYVRFTEFIGSRVKQMPDVALIWANTSHYIADEINHATKLAESLSLSALIASRSTSAEKTQAMWALRASIEKMRSIIRRSWTVSSCYIFRDRMVFMERTLPKPVIPKQTIEELRNRWWNN